MGRVRYYRSAARLFSPSLPPVCMCGLFMSFMEDSYRQKEKRATEATTRMR